MAARDIIQAAAGAAGATEAVYIEDVMATYLYTGNGASQTINNGIDLATKGGMVWIKLRNENNSHALIDTSRGKTSALVTNGSFSPFTSSDAITSFNATGFTLGADASLTAVNYNTSGTYVSWTFAKQPKFFDVVTYTGTGSARTIAHSLGATPGMIIVKRTNAAGNWQVYHNGLTSAANSIQLNLTNAQASATTVWNSTDPNSTVFSVGTDATVNASGGTYVAYLFAASNSGGFGPAGTDSVVACGSYTGNGSSLNVNLGWEPQFIMIKPATRTGDWYMFDTMRGWSNSTEDYHIRANLSNAEGTYNSGWTSTDFGNPTATGFDIKTSWFGLNNSGDTYIYLAIRRGPMKTPTDATKVFTPSLGTSGNPSFTTSHTVDATFMSYKLGGGSFYPNASSRLTDGAFLTTHDTNAENTSYSAYWKYSGYQTGMGGDAGFGSTMIGWHFRRAPGFFDVVCYTGTGSARTVAHNLGVVPELMIVKSRSSGVSDSSWMVYASQVGNDYYQPLTTVSFQGPGITSVWNSTTPTSSLFSVGTYSAVNQSSATYVAYLFATCPGVSKVGSYTGTGTTKQIDCGFAAGARFVLIKRTDSTGNWTVWDTARGIVSGNDPYLLLNSTAAEVTNTDYIDPYSAGFEISSTAPAEINASGGSFIFLAIA